MKLLREMLKSRAQQLDMMLLSSGLQKMKWNEMELHQTQITFSHCKDVLRLQTLLWD